MNNLLKTIKGVFIKDRFESAVAVVLQHEGGYSDDEYDPGGATKFGISQRFVTDHHLGLFIKDITLKQAKKIYRDYWWDKYEYNDINNLTVATKVFDMSVNMGPLQAHKLLQRAINDVSSSKITVDGLLGPETLSAANMIDEELLMSFLRMNAARFYLELVNKNPQNKVFKAGWLKRANW